MRYRGYEAVVRFDEDAGVFHGEVTNTRDVITFQGTSPNHYALKVHRLWR